MNPQFPSGTGRLLAAFTRAAGRRFPSLLMTKILALSVAALGLSCFGISHGFAQDTSFGGLGPKSEEPLQMVIDYGVGSAKHRESHHGVFDPVQLAVGQPVAITLQFLRKRAGDAVTIVPLDGGQIDLQAPATIAADGTVTFHFQIDSTPGLYRLMIAGTGQYQLSLYAVDPNRSASQNAAGR
jgi:hypothetical protein